MFRFDFGDARTDADTNVFFERQLETIKAGSYDVKYPNLLGRSLIPVDGSVPPGAEVVTYRQFDRVGVAKIIGTYGRELPRADVKGKEFTSPVKSMGTAYAYTVQDIRAAAQAGFPLDGRKAAAARRAFEELVDAIAFSGDSAHGLQGFNAIANAQTYTPGTGGTGTGGPGNLAWGANSTGITGGTPGANGLDKTSDQILADLHNAIQTMITATNGVEIPDTVLLPLNQYGAISTTARSTTSDTTILGYFLANHPYIKQVVPWYKLKGAGGSGYDRAIIYRRDPTAIGLVIPQEFEQFPPQQKGLEFEIPCHGRIGGVIAYYPMSVLYMDGI
jgi:hypothetical protein